MPGRVHRTQLSEAERRLRSQLAQLITGFGYVRGTLSVREKVCGKVNCRCARGETHRALYLVASENGKLKQLYVPRSLEAEARGWVESYQKIRQLLEELSRRQWEKLKRREL